MELQKHCLYCGKVFTAQRTTTKYCSHKCNSRHYKQQKREEKIKFALETDVARLTEPKKTKNSQLCSFNSKQYLRVSEACDFLNISRTTLWRITKKKEINYLKIGSRTLFYKKDLKKYLKKLMSKNNPEINNVFKRQHYYSIGEVTAMFDISDKALYLLLERNKIKKISQAPYVYVSKKEINSIFGINN